MDLCDALASGELKLQPHEKLNIDNDSCYLYIDNGKDDDQDCVFRYNGSPALLLRQALDLLNIPAEFV